jgi:hypothetical membrane protein
VHVSRRVGALCGIVAPSVFVAGWLVNSARTPGYDPFEAAISELAREGARTRGAMTAAFVVFGVLICVWARPLARELAVPALRPVVTVAGLATLAVAALPLTREGGQAQDTAHAVAAFTGYVAMAVTPLVAARGLRGWRREVSRLVGGVSAYALVWSVVTGSGAHQRLGLTVVDVWHVVVAASVLAGSSLRRSSLRRSP